MARRIAHFAPLALLLCGAGIIAALSPWVKEPNLLAVAPGYLRALGIAFALYGLAATVLALAPVQCSSRSGLTVLLGISVVARLALLPAEPTLSQDIYRYLWDGKIALAGHNPFTSTPRSPALADLRGPMWERTHHRTVYSPYPPVSQALFLLSALLRTDSVLMLKLLLVVLDLLAILVLMALLRSAGRPPGSALLYAWNPLVLSEIALSGHNDVLALLLFLTALLALEKRGPRGKRHGAIWLGLSIAAKPWAIFALPLIARWRGIRVAFLAPLVAGLCFLPYAGGGLLVFKGMRMMAQRDSINSSLYEVALRFAGGHVVPPEPAARLAMVVLLGAVVLLLAWKPVASSADLWRRLYYTFLAVLFCSNVVYPWYVLWICPFLALAPAPSGFLFAALVSLRHVPPWFPPGEQAEHGMEIRRLCQYLPTYAALAGELAWRWARRRGDAPDRVPADGAKEGASAQ